MKVDSNTGDECEIMNVNYMHEMVSHLNASWLISIHIYVIGHFYTTFTFLIYNHHTFTEPIELF